MLFCDDFLLNKNNKETVRDELRNFNGLRNISTAPNSFTTALRLWNGQWPLGEKPAQCFKQSYVTSFTWLAMGNPEYYAAGSRAKLVWASLSQWADDGQSRSLGHWQRLGQWADDGQS